MNFEQAISEHFKKQIDTVLPYLTKQLIRELKDQIKTESNDLWSTAEIAEYCGVHKQKVYLLTNNPTFPASVVLPKNESDNFSPKWYAKDVKQWVALHREKRAI